VKLKRTLGLALLVLLAWGTCAVAQTWTPLTNQPTFNASTSLLLTDGTVLVQQYSGNKIFRLTPDNTGSYVNGTWSQLASLPSNYAPLYYGSAVLSDGRVIFEGGEYNNGAQVETNLGAIYDPVAHKWTAVAPPAGWTSIGDGASVVLANGTYMQGDALSSKQALFNATNLTWTTTGAGKADANSEEGWLLIPGGSVLTTDANNSQNPLQAERYNPATGKWTKAGNTVVPLADPGSHEVGPSVLRPDGTALFTGGTAHNAILTLSTHTWAAGPDFPKVGGQLDAADGPAALLPNGNVLSSISPGIFQPPTHFFEFDGTNWNQEPETPNSPHKTSFEGRMLVLPTGQVMFTDGTADVEVYTSPGSPDPAWAPVIKSVPGTLTRGTSSTISGLQFNGLSQGAMYGDDGAMASNYPLVRVTNHASGHVAFFKTHGHSTMGVATGTHRVSTTFDVPTGAETGASDLSVVANGIASDPVTVTIQ
jgi:hypothetical protein